MELLSDYEVTIQYHLGKVNNVAGDLSQKLIRMVMLCFLSASKKPLVKEI